MGANATTKVPSYAAGQVLTAADLSITNSGIPVFANSTDRTNSFGGTGEKTLAEGQFAYLEDDNKTYYYDGSAWQEVGASGLAYITGTTFTSATSFSLPNSTFTSTFANYRIIVTFTSSTTGNLSMRLRASGSDITSNDYNNAFTGRTSSNEVASAANSGGSSATLCYLSDTSTQPFLVIFDLASPQLSARKAFHYQSTTAKADFGTIGAVQGGGVVNVTTACDSMSFISSNTSNLTGTYRVYGYRNS